MQVAGEKSEFGREAALTGKKAHGTEVWWYGLCFTLHSSSSTLSWIL